MSGLSPRVLAIMPALNEEATVGGVVEAIRRDLGIDVAVVDDGSTDQTAEKAIAAGAAVITHPFNLGVGAAIRTGFRFAAAKGYDVVIQVDADGQHDTGSASRVLEPVLAGHADIVVGSRFAEGYALSGARAFGMRMLSRMVSKRVGAKISDTTSGFRAFSRTSIGWFARGYPSQYLSDTVEALLLGHDLGLRIEEVPVRMRQRMGGQASSGRVKSVYHLVRLVMVILLHPVRHPLKGLEVRA
jgi:glycosyltransferase involved in cell wall biosynthesis